MRKIESQMVQAIRDGVKSWKSGNTKVVTTNDGTSHVYLHNNHIATVTYFGITLFDGGWQSNTTKSRLNAIIDGLMDGVKYGVFQKNFEWFVLDESTTQPFHSGYVLAF